MLAWFKGCKFCGEANFQRAHFRGFANFENSKFLQSANFNAINSESAFNLESAHFDEVPNFIQAHFVEAPRLDNVQVPSIGEWNGLRGSTDPNAAPRYRALKRLAIHGHDHDREQRFFADELRSLRGQPDRLLPNPLNLFRKGKLVWQGGARYWFGVFYEVFSDFGRSIPRPLILLGLATLLFGDAYFARHFLLSQSCSCVENSGSSVRAAIYLALRKALIFPGLGQDQKLDQAYACLYGTTSLAGNANEHARVIPIIPDSVAYLGIVQTLISAVLIFLFLLAVRNHFRIK
jgi:hypothetical protein